MQEYVEMKTYACRDVGVDCDWSSSAETEEELLAIITEHEKTSHADLAITPEIWAAVKAAIKDE